MSNLDDALNYFKAATISVDDWIARVDARKAYDYKNTSIYKGMKSLEAAADEAPEPPPPPPPPPSTLTVSQSLTDGSTLTAPVSWTATPSATVTSIEFYIDGTLRWTEFIAPYVFNGDPGGMLDPATLSNAVHQFKVIAKASDGTSATNTVSVTVNVTQPPPPPPSGATEGRVGFWMYGTSQMDYLVPPTESEKSFELAKWDRLECWLDSLTYHPGAMRYDDSIAIYTNSSLATQHPEWILKDTNGNKLTFYSSVQYLADPGNLAYQDFKANEVAAFIAKGYHGCKMDDVNQNAVTNPNAVNPRTGRVYTLAEWQKDIADLMTKIRTKCKGINPNFEIAHNALWWSSGVDVDRCIQQCDLYQLERGFNDSNYTPSKIVQLWGFVDKLHSMGKGAIHLSEASGTQAAHFNLACALLSSNGRDYVYSEGWRPEAYDPIYDTNLGAAKGARTQTGTNTWRRDFQSGYVTVDLSARTGTVVAF